MSHFGYVVIALVIFYCLLYLFHAAMKTCFTYPYVLFLQKTGLQLSLFQVKWYTHALNRTFSRLGTWRPALLHMWFTVGAYVSGLLVLPAMILLLQTLFGALLSKPDDSVGDRIVLQPVLPGVNMPMSEFGYYFLTLLVCSVIHEAGHAIAAVNEDVRVLGFGMFILFVLPAAFVDLPTDQLLALRPFQQLRIFSAGVWHNVTLAAFAYLVLFSVPKMSSPLYDYDHGVAVHWIEQNAAARGPTGLEVGDVIVAINDCAVTSRMTWRSCLGQAVIWPALSMCMHKDLVESSDTSSTMKVEDTSNDPLECCDSGGMQNSLCFVDVAKKVKWKQFACLPVRDALDKSGERCNSSHPCLNSDENFCMQPSLANNSRLLRVTRKDKLEFLYVGNPAEIYQSVLVSDYVPRYSILPIRMPNMLELFSHYMASFSGALAVLNVVPCFMLDGQHMIRVLVDLLFARFDGAVRSIITLACTIVGSVLLFANIIVGLWQML